VRRFALTFLVLWIALGAAAAQSPAKQTKLEGFDSFVEEVLKEWQVPGLAIAVVEDGKLIHSKGYGTRNIDKGLPATPNTLFAIGSITKSFTALSLGILAEEGKLDWDKPVRDYLPGFRLHDPLASERITPRDLVTHRSGLPRHDAVWYGSPFTRKEMMVRLRYLEPSKDFRSTWQYNNLMFMAAGMLAGHLADVTWEQHVRQTILIPLGMANSNFSVLESQKRDDFALPYAREKEQILELPFRNIDQIGPAGSINSNVEEMARYLLLHLNKGKHGGKQIVAESQIQQMHSPQMVIPGQGQYTEVGHGSYGMGWMINTYRGHKQVAHGGGIDGFAALVSFLPEQKQGSVILTNRGGNPLPMILSYNIFDRLLGLEPVNWRQRIGEQEKKARTAEEESKKKGLTTRRMGTKPSHDLKEYAGEFEHPAYGAFKIEVEKEDLKLAFNGRSTPLVHHHYDIFEIPEQPLQPFPKLKLTFLTDVKGDIASLTVPLELNVKEIVFTRMPEKALSDRRLLESLVGQYELAGRTSTVALRADGALNLTVPGQPTYELVPAKNLWFNIKGLTGFSVEFKKDPSGAVTDAIFHQPNGSFAAHRK